MGSLRGYNESSRRGARCGRDARGPSEQVESVCRELRGCGDGAGIHFLTRVSRSLRPGLAVRNRDQNVDEANVAKQYFDRS